MIISPSKPRLLITGGRGQVASAIQFHPMSDDYSLTTLAREDLDITQSSSLCEAVKKYQPDFIVNTAAYTKVDQAEIDQTACLEANFEGAKQLAIICQENQIPLIHLSTDYIFDGEASHSYIEENLANPKQIYGRSKWLGEEIIRQTCEQFIILRVSGIFSEYGHNFVKTILRLAKEKPQLSIVADQLTCPTYAGDIATVIFNLIKNYQPAKETLHFCNHPAVSWYDFASAILRCAQNDNVNIKPISTAEYPTLAKRPLNSVLNCEKIKNQFGISIPDWSIGLKKTIAFFKEVS